MCLVSQRILFENICLSISSAKFSLSVQTVKQKDERQGSSCLLPSILFSNTGKSSASSEAANVYLHTYTNTQIYIYVSIYTFQSSWCIANLLNLKTNLSSELCSPSHFLLMMHHYFNNISESLQLRWKKTAYLRRSARYLWSSFTL